MHWRDVLGLVLLGSLTTLVWYKVATDPNRITSPEAIHAELKALHEDISSLQTAQAKCTADFTAIAKAQQVSAKSTASQLTKLRQAQQRVQYTLVKPSGTMLTSNRYAEIVR